MAHPFVKSAGTKTPVGNSRAELEKMLRRYGCGGFGSQSDYEANRFSVWFHVPDHLGPGKAEMIPIKLEVEVMRVAEALYGRQDKLSRPRLEQSERVAWRQLVLWVDAACSTAASGTQRMSEAFFAHTLIKTEQGDRRLIEIVGEQMPKLLANPYKGAQQ